MGPHGAVDARRALAVHALGGATMGTRWHASLARMHFPVFFTDSTSTS